MGEQLDATGIRNRVLATVKEMLGRGLTIPEIVERLEVGTIAYYEQAKDTIPQTASAEEADNLHTHYEEEEMLLLRIISGTGKSLAR